MGNNIVMDKSFELAVKIIQFCESLEKERKYVISRQLLKSGTSIGANIKEAQSPHSRKDFIAKMIIAIKESEETEYWLQLCEKSEGYPCPQELLGLNTEVKKLLGRIISTARINEKRC